MGVVAPCKDCERKGCGSYHDKCEKFIKFKNAKAKTRETEIENYSRIRGMKSRAHHIRMGNWRNLK